MNRVVLDTNVLISAFFWHGPPARAYELLALGRFQALITLTTLDEITYVLHRAKLAKRLAQTGLSANSIVQDYQILAEPVEPAEIPFDAVRDPKDRAILACAVGGHADFIVTGDRDLLDLGSYAGILILTPAGFLESLDSQDSD